MELNALGACTVWAALLGFNSWVAIKMWFCWFIAHTKCFLPAYNPSCLLSTPALASSCCMPQHWVCVCVCWCLPAVFLFAKLIGNKIPQQLLIIIWDDASRTLRHQSVQAQLQRRGWGSSITLKSANVMTDIRHTKNNESLASETLANRGRKIGFVHEKKFLKKSEQEKL